MTTPEEFVVQCVPGATRAHLRPYEYSTSHLIQQVEVEVPDRGSVDLLLKRMGERDLLPQARGVKPSFVLNREREPYVYREILADAGLGTARLVGHRHDQQDGWWLLLEKVPGVELFQVGEVEIWSEAARWLARAHVALSSRAAQLPEGNPLLALSPSLYRRWLELAGGNPLVPPRLLQRMQAGWDQLVERLEGIPRTVLHGEFYASNVLVAAHHDGVRICPVDWEMASAGPGIIDLAALVTGWPEQDQLAIAAAYLGRLDELGWAADAGQFDLRLARMLLCIQWLGWARSWKPPPEHGHDWLAEAEQLAVELGW